MCVNDIYTSRTMASSDIKDRYVEAMVLAGVGDAIGYRNARWEFCYSGPIIHKELGEMGGVKNVTVKLPDWRVSDDTVMHLVMAESLMLAGPGCYKETLYRILARAYKNCWNDMEGREPGITCKESIDLLDPDKEGGYRIPFNKKGGGCGAAMRAMCIGLIFPESDDVDDFIEVSIESSRMTHHHPTGYLGALATALFTSYAMQGRPIRNWGRGLLETLPIALEYVRNKGHYVEENEEAWGYFEEAWARLLKTSVSLTDC